MSKSRVPIRSELSTCQNSGYQCPETFWITCSTLRSQDSGVEFTVEQLIFESEIVSHVSIGFAYGAQFDDSVLSRLHEGGDQERILLDRKRTTAVAQTI